MATIKATNKLWNETYSLDINGRYLKTLHPKCVAIHLDALMDNIHMSPLEQIMTDLVKHRS
jgi:hypothetical protein